MEGKSHITVGVGCITRVMSGMTCLVAQVPRTAKIAAKDHTDRITIEMAIKRITIGGVTVEAILLGIAQCSRVDIMTRTVATTPLITTSKLVHPSWAVLVIGHCLGPFLLFFV